MSQEIVAALVNRRHSVMALLQVELHIFVFNTVQYGPDMLCAKYMRQKYSRKFDPGRVYEQIFVSMVCKI